MRSLYREYAPIFWVVGFIVAMLSLCVVVDWYRAGVQARIYERQGIKMTQWEVFMGAEPAEKVIQVPE
jgi:hypothetical protein